MNKLIDAGYNNKLFTLEEGVKDYLESYLKKKDNANLVFSFLCVQEWLKNNGI